MTTQEERRAAKARQIMGFDPSPKDEATLIAEYEAEFGAWITSESLAEQKKKDRADDKEARWSAAVSNARAGGWKSVSEIGDEMGIAWHQVLSWVDTAGLFPDEFTDLDPDDEFDQPRATSSGLYPVARAKLVKHYETTMRGYRTDDDAANAEADALVERLLEEKEQRRLAVEEEQRAYRERVFRERQAAEIARQERLANTRENQRLEYELQGAKSDVRLSRRQAKLARRQYYASANRALWAVWAWSRRGKQNFEYASTKPRPVGRRWAKEVMERYQRNYESALTALGRAAW